MRSLTIIFAISCVILVAGASFAYCFDSDTGFDAQYNDDGTVRITATGGLPAEIAYRVLSGTHTPERIYLYLDEDYCGSIVSYREQSRNLRAVETLLGNRGYDSVEYIGAERLAQLVGDASAASVSGIMMMSGSIPEAAYPDDSSNGLSLWMSNGGTVYWSGPDMGRFRALSGGECEEVSNGGMFGGYVNYATEGFYLVSESTEMSVVTGFVNNHAEYGLSTSYTDSTMKILGLSGDYSSLSVVSVGAGRAYILGSNLSSLEVENLYSYADIIVSGITENTLVKETGSFSKKYGSSSCSTDVTVSAGDVVYITSGKPVTDKGKAFLF